MTTNYIDDVVGYSNRYLRVDRVPDDPRALNGLQVENSGRLDRIVAAVDASQASIDAAGARRAGLLLVHHGLFWDGLQPITGRHARRLQALHRHDLALYSAHIPLDCHPDVGNNAVLGREIGLGDCAPFGDYQGCPIGIVGTSKHTRDTLVELLRAKLGVDATVIPGGSTAPGRVAIVSGDGASFLKEARDCDVGTLITGEARHHSYFDAQEWGLNLILAGHYATETLGVRALAAHLASHFAVSWEFVDLPTGL